MVQQLVRAVCGLCGLFFLPILLIRAQPFDNSALRAFLNASADCPAPCFMGIQPGITREADAIARLTAHDWVRWAWLNRSYDSGHDSDALLNWQWAEEAPAFVRQGDNYGIAVIRQGVVVSLHFSSTISIGQLLLALGSPDTVQVGTWAATNDFNGSLDVSYTQAHLSARLLLVECPRLAALREMETIIYFTGQGVARGDTGFNHYRSGPIVRDVYGCSGF